MIFSSEERKPTFCCAICVNSFVTTSYSAPSVLSSTKCYPQGGEVTYHHRLSSLISHFKDMECSMDNLPDDVLLLILNMVPSRELFVVGRVCRRWAALGGRRALRLGARRHLRALRPALRALVLTARLRPPRAPLACTPLLRALTVHARSPLADADVAALARLPHLAHLDAFLASRAVTERALPALRPLASLVLNQACAGGVLGALAAAGNLRELHMYGRALYYPRRELRVLLGARRDQLRELTLRCTELSDREYEAIGACAGLETLRLYSCWLLRAAGAAHVARPRRLRVLHVTGARMLRPRALAGFLAALPDTVEELVLSSSWFTAAHTPLLTRLPRLRTLELWRCRISAPEVLELAAALPALAALDLDAALSAGDVAALAAHPALERLRCRRSDLRAGAPDSSGGECAGGLRVLAADACYAGQYLRGGGEGLRADLFYFWTAHGELPPRGPAGEADDEDDDIIYLNCPGEAGDTADDGGPGHDSGAAIRDAG